MSSSIAQQIAGLSDEQLAQLTPEHFGALSHSWEYWGRPEQFAPPGNWRGWLILAGRGWGKTRTGAEWVRWKVENGANRIALVAPTRADARDVVIEGESGLLSVFPKAQRPQFQTSKRRVIFHTGAIATLYSAEEPERLRGPQHDAAWCDELAAWRNVEDTWSNLLMGLRLGERPQWMVTTTPRPIPLIRSMVDEATGKNPGLVLTRGKTHDNAANLAPGFIDRLLAQYAGTRLAKQELEGEILEDVPGALFKIEWIRRARNMPDRVRTIVAIDPAISQRRTSDETGIIVAAKGSDGHVYVLADLSGKYSPDQWARKAIKAYHDFDADRIVAETNRGGDLVESTLRTLDSGIVFKDVKALKGKTLRAEPVAALYEQGRVMHVGSMQELEHQMTTWDPTLYESPDRVDALVWAITDLMLQRSASFSYPQPTQGTPRRF